MSCQHDISDSNQRASRQKLTLTVRLGRLVAQRPESTRSGRSLQGRRIKKSARYGYTQDTRSKAFCDLHRRKHRRVSNATSHLFEGWKMKWPTQVTFSRRTLTAASAAERYPHRRWTTSQPELSSRINTDPRAWNSLLALTAIDRHAPMKRCWRSFVALSDHVETTRHMILIDSKTSLARSTVRFPAYTRECADIECG